MKDRKTRKEQIAQYARRKVIGGVFTVRNTQTDKLLLEASADLSGSRNRFDFAQKTGSCTDLKLQSDWEKQGGGSFVFEVLEEIARGETQTDAEFAGDLKLLKEIWQEKLAGRDFY